MKTLPIEKIILPLAILALSLAYLAGVASVPFHPDESTQLFMSADFNTLFSQPATLFWSPSREGDTRQKYRELDAPLARDLIGAGRTIAGLPALPADWDWTQTWDANQAAGALPDPRLLLVGRLSVAILFPASLYFLYKSGAAIGGRLMGWISLILLASNALVLLHTRRAMAEGGLVFAITLFLWALTRPDKPAWLIAIPAALVFCSKQSAGVLGLVGLAFACWQAYQQKRSLAQILLVSALYGMVFVGLVFLLNPFLWSNPIQASLAAIHAREVLIDNQISALQAAHTGQVLDSLPLRVLGLVAQLFISQPAIADIGNYLAQTNDASMAYFSSPLTHLLRDFVGGGLLLILSLTGFILAAARALKPGRPSQGLTRLFLLANLLIFIVIVWLIPIAWQRYYLPLVPFTCLWTAYALYQAFSLFRRVQPQANPLRL